MSFPRYPKYKPSGVEWLGEVPEGWAVVPLRWRATCNDDVLDEQTAPDSEIAYVDISGVDGRAGITHTEVLRFGDAPSRARRRVRDGDVIVSTVRTYLRAIAAVRSPPPNLIVSTGFAVIRPSHGVDGHYVSFALSAAQFVEQVVARSVGVSYPAINASELMRIEILVPPLPEQRAIAAFLDRETGKIDALVAEQERLIELLNEKRQAVISHAVTKGLNPKAPMKDSGIEWLGEVPAHWEVSRVKSLSTFTTSGPRGWSERISDDGSVFVQSGDLRDDLGVSFGTANRVLVDDDAEAARTRLVEGDVLVCITGAKTGKVAVASGLAEEAYINQHICLVRPAPGTDPRFLGLALKSPVGQTQFELSQYGLKQGLSLENVRAALVPLPPLAEQHAIVAHLDRETSRIDALLTEAQRAIDLLQERRSALISAAVTGQIDVRKLGERAA